MEKYLNNQENSCKTKTKTETIAKLVDLLSEALVKINRLEHEKAFLQEIISKEHLS